MLRLPVAGELLRLLDLRGGHESCDTIVIEWSGYIALLTGDDEPHECQHIVLRDALAILVQGTEFVLGPGNALLSGLAVPRRGQSIVPWDTVAFFVHLAEVGLRVGIALFSG